MDISQRLLLLMKERGLSRYALARELGVHTSTVTNWCEGNEPLAKSIFEIAKYFNVSQEYLTGETDIRVRPTVTEQKEALMHRHEGNNELLTSEEIELIERYRKDEGFKKAIKAIADMK